MCDNSARECNWNHLPPRALVCLPEMLHAETGASVSSRALPMWHSLTGIEKTLFPKAYNWVMTSVE